MSGRRSFLRRALGAAAGLVAAPFGARAVAAGGFNSVGTIGVEAILPRKPLNYGTCYDGVGCVDAARAMVARIERHRLDVLAGSDPCDPWPEPA
jgi:hypothetical protein